jgi:hypothetical protein
MTGRSTQEKLEAVQSLAKSLGWLVLREAMETEIRIVERRLASDRPMTPDEMHFKRGQLNTAYAGLEVPDRIIRVLENQLMIELATTAAKDLKKPASAGKEKTQ